MEEEECERRASGVGRRLAEVSAGAREAKREEEGRSERLARR